MTCLDKSFSFVRRVEIKMNRAEDKGNSTTERLQKLSRWTSWENKEGRREINQQKRNLKYLLCAYSSTFKLTLFVFNKLAMIDILFVDGGRTSALNQSWKNVGVEGENEQTSWWRNYKNEDMKKAIENGFNLNYFKICFYPCFRTYFLVFQ